MAHLTFQTTPGDSGFRGLAGWRRVSRRGKLAGSLFALCLGAVGGLRYMLGVREGKRQS